MNALGQTELANEIARIENFEQFEEISLEDFEEARAHHLSILMVALVSYLVASIAL